MRPRRRTGVAAYVVGALVATLALGCTTPDLSPEPGAAADASAPGPGGDGASEDDGAGDGPRGAPDRGAPDGDPHVEGGSVPACEDATRSDIDEVIGAQLAAFAADDYEAALEFASEDFRASIDAEGLAGIIEQGYPIAADAAGHESGVCVQPSSTTAEIAVRVTARDGARGELVYRLVEEEPGWRIAGAVQVGDGRDDEATVT